MSGLVVGLLGTDHHPFDRLVGWLDAAAQRYPEHRFIVQHGDSAPPLIAEGRAFLPHEELRELVAVAALVVCHGGPGTIVDARDCGQLPVCVPRDPLLGEHVDAHQQRFCEVVAPTGLVRPARTRAEFDQAVAGVLTGELTRRSAPLSADSDRARRSLALELDDLMRRRTTSRLRRLAHVRRSGLRSA